MRKVEAQDLGRHHRTLLLDVRSQHLAQRLVHEVRRGVVVGRGLAFGSVHDGRELGRRVFGKLLDDMDNQAVLLFGSHDGDALVGILDIADVADLAARVAVERRAVEDQLVGGLAFGGHAAVTGDLHPLGQRVVAREDALPNGEQLHPVVGIDGRGVARTLLLCLQLGFKGCEVNADALFAGDELRQVDREPERIVKLEGVLARDQFAALFLGLFDHAVQQADARGQRTQERGFLLLDDLFDQRLLGLQLGELATHLLTSPGTSRQIVGSVKPR